MDKGLFDTLLYLIPVAFFIAIRIIGSKSAKNRNSRAEGQKRAAVKPQAKKAPAKSSYRPAFPDTVTAAEEDVRVQNASAETVRNDTAARSSVQQTGVIKPGLTPLQQAFVWAEILGSPRGA